jgi:hypothetical protein
VGPITLRDIERCIFPFPVAEFPGVAELQGDFIYSPARGPTSLVAMDEVLSTIAGLYRARTTAIVLSGTSLEGMVGTLAVRTHKGLVMVQEPATADFSSLPLFNFNNAHCAVAPSAMPDLVAQYIVHGKVPSLPATVKTATLAAYSSCLQNCAAHAARAEKELGESCPPPASSPGWKIRRKSQVRPLPASLAEKIP